MFLITMSITLDAKMLFMNYLSLPEKIGFITKKYLIIAKHTLSGFNLSQNPNIKFWEYNYYYDNRYGISLLQGTLCDQNYLKNIIPKNLVIIDVGANIGQFRLVCEKIFKAKTVYSFEAVDTTFDTLHRNFLKNSFNLGITDKSSLKMFYTEGKSGHASMYNIYETDAEK